MSDSLRTVLDKLDEWRHLPAYRLEQHVDVLFGMTLPRVLSCRFDIPKDELCVIPEFPIHLGTLEGRNSNHSINVDFSVWSPQRQRVFLVELKTDMGTLKHSSEQLCRMVKIRSHGPFGVFIDRVRTIAKESDQPRKYAQLLWSLHKVDAVSVPPAFKKKCMEHRTPGLTGKTGVFQCCHATATYEEAKPSLVLITPTLPSEDDKIPSEFECIDFHQYAHIIHGTGDLEDTLAYYLLRWQRPAGVTNPWRGTGS